MPDGDFRPAASASEPKEWKKGDRVKCIDDGPWLTEGKIYTLEEGERESAMTSVVMLIDDDGDRMEFPKSRFVFVGR